MHDALANPIFSEEKITMKQKLFILGLLVVGLALLLVGCAAPEAPECPDCPEVECPEAECPEVDCPECEACPEPEACPEYESVLPGLEAAFMGSAHAAADTEAFRHWDGDDPAVIPTYCAKCHSPQGYADFHGADGSEAGTIEADVPALEVQGLTCETCHNRTVGKKTSVVMPSGVELTDLGDESRCMECHQGRQSSVSLEGSIAEAAGVETGAEADPDMVYEELGFANIHYYPATATKYGTMAKGGAEFAGKSYDGNFAHVEEFDTCIECHSPHTLEVKADGCVMCHGDGELTSYRMLSSAVDYDGDGDIEEGIAFEIEGLHEALYAAIQAYATDTAGAGVIYASAYPYFFIDTDGDGAESDGEAAYPNKYASWTPNLLRAAYNYQMAKKDHGAFAHGGKYIIQLLYDSIEAVGGDVSAFNRDDHGHFKGSSRAFRYFDPGTRHDGVVGASCSKCHSADGLPLFAEEGVTISQAPSNGFQCETCHAGEWPGRYAFEAVTFPSGVTVDQAEGDESTLCMQCHQGRTSGADVVRTVGDAGDNDALEGARFSNVHYFPAGATRYGADAAVGYQYDGKEYAGLFAHVPGYATCMDCHDAHELEVQEESCFTCHAGLEDTHDINMAGVDYDGDGEVEGLAVELHHMEEVLYEAIVAYSIANESTNEVVYKGHYPYWFAANEGEDLVWSPTLLRAAFNYQFAHKDPGAFAHNGKYIGQLLYDTLEAIGGDVTGMTRP